ncbi:MAG: hypothetical protein ACK5LV_11205 [Lachnospirales bacterium]
MHVWEIVASIIGGGLGLKGIEMLTKTFTLGSVIKQADLSVREKEINRAEEVLNIYQITIKDLNDQIERINNQAKTAYDAYQKIIDTLEEKNKMLKDEVCKLKKEVEKLEEYKADTCKHFGDGKCKLVNSKD